MADSIRVGLISTSWWTDYLLPMLQSHPQAVAQAICGRNRSRAEEVAQKYHIPQVFTDYREMIEKGGLQAVIVASPDDLHYPMVMDALDAGLHVICEKPMALTTADAKAMYDKANSKGLKNMVYYTWHWLPRYRFIKLLVDEGYVGRCYHFQLGWLAPYWRNPAYSWHFDRQRSHGVLSDLGSHMIHFAQWYMGDITQVCANFSTFVKRPDVNGKPSDSANDTVDLLVRYANGAQGTILSMRQDEREFTALTVPNEFWENADKKDYNSVYRTQSVGMHHFIDCILNDKPAYPGFYEGYKVQQVINAALESHEKGAWVTVGTV
jgi:predicted dehydrogenase